MNNKLSEEAGQLISRSLQQLKNLEKLQLRFNNSGLEDVGVRHVVQALEQCSKLQHLQVVLGSGSPENVIQISEILDTLRHLEYLHLALHNYGMKDREVKKIGQTLRNLNKLNTLKLWFYGNQISLEGGLQVVEDVQNLQDLNELEIDFRVNGIQDGNMLREKFDNLKIDKKELEF